MIKFAKMACLVALCSGFAMGCGDDDGDKVEGCIMNDDTCHESAGIGGQACDLFGGTTGSCSKDKVDGTCEYTEDGHSTTIYYYTSADGDAWQDEFGDAEENCADYDGKFTDK